MLTWVFKQVFLSVVMAFLREPKEVCLGDAHRAYQVSRFWFRPVTLNLPFRQFRNKEADRQERARAFAWSQETCLFPTRCVLEKTLSTVWEEEFEVLY